MIGVLELEKPANVRCCHLGGMGRCTIYAERPESCRTFECVWLQGFVPTHLSPVKTGVIVYDLKELHERRIMYLHVAPTNPRAWRRGAFSAWLDDMIARDWLAVIVCGDERTIVGNDAHEFKLETMRAHPNT